MFTSKRKFITVWVLTGVPPCTSMVFSQMTLINCTYSCCSFTLVNLWKAIDELVVLWKFSFVRGASFVPLENAKEISIADTYCISLHFYGLSFT